MKTTKKIETYWDVLRMKKTTCDTCQNLGYNAPQSDQPYPEFWCVKGRWDAISNLDDLSIKIECIDYKSQRIIK